jgi:hypothetical protein
MTKLNLRASLLIAKLYANAQTAVVKQSAKKFARRTSLRVQVNFCLVYSLSLSASFVLSFLHVVFAPFVALPSLVQQWHHMLK